MAENLPDWAVEGAEVVFIWNPSGMGRGEVKQAVIEKITPTGQVRTSVSPLRFMPGDYSERENRFNRYLHNGRWSNGSIELLPRDHPRIPRLVAEQERERAWSRVRVSIVALERNPSLVEAERLRIALASWEGAVTRLDALG